MCVVIINYYYDDNKYYHIDNIVFEKTFHGGKN